MTAFNYAEALRYMGTVPQDKDAAAVCAEVHRELIKVVKPKYLLKRVNCRVVAEGVYVGDYKFSSRNLAVHLAGCRELLLFAATLGIDADRIIRSYTFLSMAKVNAAQGVAAVMIEDYCNKVLLQYPSEPLKKRVRFSPGYGDWSLDEQKIFFSLLDCSKIGLTLTAGGMMAPLKSVTAVVGLGIEKENNNSDCDTCSLRHCVYRK